MNSKRYLFVAGAPRSGTTAMVDFLNSNRQIIMLSERYFHRIIRDQLLSPDDFEEERMFTFQENDSWHNAIAPSEGTNILRLRYPTAVCVGDKVPRLYEQFAWISQSFPQSTVILMVRNIFDVAASYNRRARDQADTIWPMAQDFTSAVKDWNWSLRATLESLREFSNIEIICVNYEQVFFSRNSYAALYARLGLEIDSKLINLEKLEGVYKGAATLEASRPASLTSGEKQYLCSNADFEAYKSVQAASKWLR